MTTRTEIAHRAAETRARLMTRMATYLFSQRDTLMTRLVKKLLKADQAAEYTDPDLQHPSAQ